METTPDLSTLIARETEGWSDDAQRILKEAILEMGGNGGWRPFYCPQPGCNGRPHGNWVWNHARADQHPPKDWGDAYMWMLLAGRGAGKTRSGSEWTHRYARANPGCYIGLVAPTTSDARDVIVEGEALALDTLVATPEGFTTMGDLSVGDYVLGADGLPVRVAWCSEVAEDRPCFRVTLTSGESFIADAKHKWLTTYVSGNTVSVRTTDRLAELVSPHHSQSRVWIECADPLDLPDAALPVPPYTLGAWLGDGHSHHAAVTTMDPEVLDGITADGFRVRRWESSVKEDGPAAAWGILGLSRILKEHDLLHNKRLPDIYLRASHRQRLDLLRGLLDTDGTISKRGQIEFTNTNKDLVFGVQELCATLGIKARITVKHGPDHLPLYRLRFTSMGAPVFTVARHVARLMSSAFSPVNTRHYIQSVEPVPSVPVRCIAVDNEDHLYLIGHTLIPTHNSGILATSHPAFRPEWEPSKRRLTWPNNSTATTFSDDTPERLRGPQHHAIWCFPAGTMIRTADGQVPVERVADGDLVWTRAGLRPVVAVGSRVAAIYEVNHEHGVLRGTAEHPVMTQRGWVPLGDLAQGDILSLWQDDGDPTVVGTSSSTRLAGRSTSTERFGSRRMGRSRTDGTFTTSTGTRPTTRSRILNWWRQARTSGFTSPAASANFSSRVPSAGSGSPTSLELQPCRSTAQSSAGSTLASVAVLDRNDSAPTVVLDSTPGLRDSAVSGASTSVGVGVVWNLQVQETPEFFADDVLVHNCDELAAYRNLETTWSNAMFGLRLGTHPKVLITTTPKPLKFLRELVKDPQMIVSTASTYDNIANLAVTFRQTVIKRYEGTALGEQELNALILDDDFGEAMWIPSDIQRLDIPIQQSDLGWHVVAVDPGVTTGGDATGIVVMAATSEREPQRRRGVVLADQTMVKASPEQWAQRIVSTYHALPQPCVVIAESNQGGELVSTVIHQIDQTVPVSLVHSHKSKQVRAEPVVMAYRMGRVVHVDKNLGDLEAEMTSWIPGISTESPNRIDALVHGLTALLVRSDALRSYGSIRRASTSDRGLYSEAAIKPRSTALADLQARRESRWSPRRKPQQAAQG